MAFAWGFPKLGGTLLASLEGNPSNWGLCKESPIFVNPHLGFCRHERHGREDQGKLVHDVQQVDPPLWRREGPHIHLHSKLQLVVLQKALNFKAHCSRVLEAEKLEEVRLGGLLLQSAEGFPATVL